MSNKMTTWYLTHIKPVRTGVYEVRHYPNGRYAYFDGFEWGHARKTIYLAGRSRNTSGASQDKEWRGLAEKPK